MEQITSGSVTSVDEHANLREKMLFTYSEEEKQENEIDHENAKLVFSPKFIPFYPELLQYDLTNIAILLYGFIDFYLSTSTTAKFYFTNEQLGKIVGCHADTASSAIKSLEKTGFIKTHRKIKSGGGQIRYVRKTESDSVKNSVRLGKKQSQTLENIRTKDNKIKDNKINKNNNILQSKDCVTSVEESQELLKNTTPTEHEEIVKILDIFKTINPTINYGNKTQRRSIVQLLAQFSFSQLAALAKYAVAIQGKKYAPTITTPYQLHEKVAALKIYHDRENSNKLKILNI